MPAAKTKTCPQCAESVKRPALICRYCRYEFDDVLERGGHGGSDPHLEDSVLIARAMYPVEYLSDDIRADLMLKKGRSGQGFVSARDISNISESTGINYQSVEEFLEDIGYSIGQNISSLANNIDYVDDSQECSEVQDEEDDNEYYEAAIKVDSEQSIYLRIWNVFYNNGVRPHHLYISVIVLIALAGLIWGPVGVKQENARFSTESASDADSSSRDQTLEGMDFDSQQRYDSMNSRQQDYVDDQMKRYDELCARSSDC
jgi:hypothetical protein